MMIYVLGHHIMTTYKYIHINNLITNKNDKGIAFIFCLKANDDENEDSNEDDVIIMT